MAAEVGAAGGAGDSGGSPLAPPGQKEAAKKNPKVEWSKEEDELLRELVELHGDNCWRLISDMMITAGRRRSDKSCRNRWTQHLDPSSSNAHIRKPPRCLRLFPVTPGFHHKKQAAAQPAPPLAFVEDDAAGPGRSRSGAVPEYFELFPLAPGDVRDNDGSPAAAAAMDVDSEAVRSFTELRLAPGGVRRNAAVGSPDVDC